MNRNPIPICFIITFLFISIGFAQTKNFVYKKLLRPANTEYYHMNVALCEDYPEWNTTHEKIDKDMVILKKSGIKILRIAFQWDAIESEKGKFDYLFWDYFVKSAYKNNITLIPYICYTPRWNTTGDSTNFWNHTPVDYEEFGNIVTALVNHYKKYIHSWELWNEPDIKDFFSGNAEDLAKLVKIGSLAVRKADPTALVVLAGLAHHVDFTLRLFRDYGISKYVDVVNCHDYSETWSGEPIESITSYINALSNIIKKYGNGQSLWTAEVGYSDFRKGAYVSSSYNAYYDYEHTPEYQAKELFKTMTLINSTGKVATAAWYRITDLQPDLAVIGDVNNRYLGIVTLNHNPKPAMSAIAFFDKLFRQKNKSIDSEIQIEKKKNSDSQVHCFENADGSVIIVAWLQTYVRNERGVDTSGEVKDTRSENISLSIPAKLKGVATIYNEIGKSKKFNHFVVNRNSTLIKNLTLYGGKITIIKLEK
ncbi:MAG: GH39 family glycosyl hydrolase [Ignavibacteriaceae bacterium]